MSLTVACIVHALPWGWSTFCILCLLGVFLLLQDLVSSIQRVLADNNMQARAVPVAQEVAAYGGVAQAADIALSAANPWGCL